jgi:hypothetical protein
MTITAAPTTTTTTTYSLPGVDWLSVQVQGDGGTLTIGDTHVSAHVTAPADGAPARLEADPGDVTLGGLSAALGAGSADPLSALPSPLASYLCGVSITSVAVTFDTEAARITEFDLKLVGTKGFALVPGSVEVDDLAVTFSVSNAGGSVAFAVTGAATLSGSPVALAVTHDESDSYAVSLTSAGAPVPGSPTVTAIVGGELTSHLPAELAHADFGLSVATATFRKATVDTLDVILSTGSPLALPDPVALTVDRISAHVTVSHPTDPAVRSISVSLEGDTTFAGAAIEARLEASASSGAEPQWTLTGGLADGAVLTASAVAQTCGATLPSQLPDLTLSELSVEAVLGEGTLTIKAASATEWTVPVGPDGIGVGHLAVTFTRHAPDADGHTFGGSISGTVHLAGVDVPVAYTVPGGLSLSATIPQVAPFAMLRDLCGDTAVGALALPPELLALGLTDVALSIDVTQQEASFAAGGPGFKRVQAVVRKATTWGFALGIELDDTYEFSSLSPALGGLDSVHLPGALIVISSFDDATFSFDELQPVAGKGVSRGALVDGRLDLSGLGADTFLGESHLDVSAHLGTSLSDVSLEASVADVHITDGVVLKDAEFELVPDPENISIQVSGAVDVTLDSSPLEFIGGVKVVPNGISFFATMKGTWQDPFGAKGIALTDVSLEIGSDFEGVPSIGIAGGLAIGAFSGHAAVSFNSELPTQSVLIVAFNHLSLLDVVETFCPASVTAGIPKEVSGTLAGVSLEDVDLYVVPQDTSIGKLTYKQGLRVGGTLQVAGFTVQGMVEIDPADGVAASGSLSPVHIADVFSLTGADPQEGPTLDLEVNTTSVPTIAIAGQVTMLGLAGSAHVNLSDAGFDFGCKGQVFGLFDADVTAKGGKLESGDGFLVHADMHQSFLTDLARRAAATLQQAGADASAQIAAAQHAVDTAQADVQRLTAAGDAARADLGAVQSDAQAKIQAAQAGVTRAQNALSAINAQVASTKAAVQSERDAAAARLRDAQAKLSVAQSAVDSLNSQISSEQLQIDQLNSDIGWWHNWYNNLAWYDKAWGWTKLGVEVGWRGTQVAGLTAAIAGLRASELTANGVLDVARQTAQAAQAASATYPVDQDPRVLALQGGLAAAQLGVQTAQGVLATAQQSTTAAVAAAAQTVTGLVQQLAQATDVLQTASAALGGLRQAVGSAADIVGYVAAHGLGSLLDVRSASFDGTLTATSGGSVTLAADVVLQGAEQRVRISYDFHDLAAGAKALAQQLLPGIPV